MYFKRTKILINKKIITTKKTENKNKQDKT